MTNLHRKYNVERLNDPTGKHADCRYFILDPQHDPIALAALGKYARLCIDENPELAEDLFRWINELEDADA